MCGYPITSLSQGGTRRLETQSHEDCTAATYGTKVLQVMIVRRSPTYRFGLRTWLLPASLTENWRLIIGTAGSSVKTEEITVG
jgi:hypothetical protein